ncbi:MAG: hypothetical protein HRU15_00695 [Planctomycetes bacterium]|nr:hypothetical protein [Planctomycetota bacterium]
MNNTVKNTVNNTVNSAVVNNENRSIFHYEQQGLQTFWRSLENKTSFIIHCSERQVSQVCSELEEIGACAIDCTPDVIIDNQSRFVIHAYKGKRGPCYQTGRSARLTLNEYAVCDDDGHLLSGELAVCEKTAGIYQLPVYQNWIRVSDADKDLLQTFVNDPQNFDCDTVEEDARKFVHSLPSADGQDLDEKNQHNVFYGGPFRLLICPTGEVLRRGQVQKLSAVMLKDLQKHQAHIYLWQQNHSSIQPSWYFQDRYQQQGVSCLFEFSMTEMIIVESEKLDLSALKQCPTHFLSRVQKMIVRKDAYLLLSGSDPTDPLGCCPSEDVAQAHALCRAGIFESFQHNTAESESCPMTIFTFKQEIDRESESFSSTVNESLRATVAQYIPGQTFNRWQSMFRAALLIFVLCSLIVTVLRIQRDYRYAGDIVVSKQLVSALDIPQKNCVIISLFHKEKRCEFCLDMEQHAREYIQNSDASSLYFRQVTMDMPTHQGIAEHLDLFTSSIVLFTLVDGQITSSDLIEELWSLTKDGDGFKKQLHKSLSHLSPSLKGH